MDDNEKKEVTEEVANEEAVQEEAPKPFTVVENGEAVEEEQTPTTEEEATEKMDGEAIPPMDPEAMSGMAGALGSMLGGGGADYSDVFKQVMTIFERLNSDLDKVDTNVITVNDDLEETKADLAATKLYTKLLTKMIIATDIVFAIAIILILIFK